MHTFDPQLRQATTDLCARRGATGFTVGWQGDCTNDDATDTGWWAQVEYQGLPLRVAGSRSPNVACLRLVVALLGPEVAA